MSALQSRTRGSLILVLIWLALAAGGAVQYLNPPNVPDPLNHPDHKQRIPKAVNTTAASVMRVADLKKFTAIVKRPLFYPDRRPLPPEPKEKPAPPPSAPDVKLTLVGVFLTANAKVALIRNDQTHKVSRLNIGEEVANWQLEKVKPESVTLRRGDRSKQLPLLRNQTKPGLPTHRAGPARNSAKSVRERLRKRLEQRNKS